MSNIIQDEENQFKISRVDVNQLIPSLKSAYYELLIQRKYLPKLTSSIITSEYLLGVIFEKTYVPNLSEVQIGVLLKAVKYEIIKEVQKIQIQQKAWGMSQIFQWVRKKMLKNFSYIERKINESRQKKENFEEENFGKQNGQKAKNY